MSENNQAGAFHDAATREKLQQVQSNFGAAAADYVTSKVHASGEDLDWVVEAAALTGTERVLDVATGGGHTAFALAPHAAEVVALDLTQEMLTVAQKEAVKRHLDAIRFQKGDAQSLPFEDGSFDVVACRFAAHHFPHVRQAVQEWARVLKPGGKLVLVDSASPEEPEADTLLHEVELLRDPSHVRNQRISEWKEILQATGFTVDAAREWGLILEVDNWTQRMRTPAAAVASIEQRLQDASPETRARLHIEQKGGAFAFSLPVALIVAIGTGKASYPCESTA